MNIEAVVEIPQGSRNKYEMDHKKGRIFEREYGPDHVEVARTLTSLGNAWSELGKPDKARDLLRAGATHLLRPLPERASAP